MRIIWNHYNRTKMGLNARVFGLIDMTTRTKMIPCSLRFFPCSVSKFPHPSKEKIYLHLTWSQSQTCADPEWGPGVRTLPVENKKTILVRTPWKCTTLSSQHSMLGHHHPSSETPFKWRFAGGPMVAHLF